MDAVARCRFEEGDILYDTPLAYGRTWSESAPHIRYSIQVLSPKRGNQFGNFDQGWEQEVVFLYKNHLTSSQEMITTTQGCLYTFLRTGDPAYLHSNKCLPKLGKIQSLLKKSINEVSFLNHFHTKTPHKSNHQFLFIMPYDHASTFRRIKATDVWSVLSPKCDTAIHVSSLASIGITKASSFSATAAVVSFCMNGASEQDIIQSLRSILYKPTSKESSKDGFKIERHGWLIPYVDQGSQTLFDELLVEA